MSRNALVGILAVAVLAIVGIGVYFAQTQRVENVPSVPVASASPTAGVGTGTATALAERPASPTPVVTVNGTVAVPTPVAASTETAVPGGGSRTTVAAADVDAFFEEVTLELLTRNPELFSELGLPPSYKPDFRHNKLTDLSDAYTKETYRLVEGYLERLKGFDRSGFSPQQELSASILEWSLEDWLRGEEFMYNDYIVNPAVGVQNNIQEFMASLHPLNTKQQAEDYITRLNQFDEKFEGIYEVLRIREQRGILMPGWMIGATLGQMRDFISVDAKENILYTAYKARLEPLQGLSDVEKAELYAGVEREINQSVYPAYRKLIEYFQELQPKGRDTDGVWALPNGDAYYRYTLRHHTTSDMTPEEIHQLGLKEVERVRGEMQSILDDLGYRGKSFTQAMQEAGTASGVHQLNSPEAKEKLLARFRDTIERADKGMGDLFDVRPKVGVEVRAVPAYRECCAAVGSYYGPALDGSRPGIFYANLGRPSFAQLDIPTLAYHEATPGHHFQLGIQSELTGLPVFRRAPVFSLYTGYVEGWALYAERLMAEAGFYKDDPYGNLGWLKAELFRSARLVVDTGIHNKRWTVQQASDYMSETLGAPPGAYMGEVVRYTAWPGQATAYKIGEIKIVELRERARRELGSKFDIKEFHNVVLQNGAMPLEVLEKAVENYIASKK